MMMSEAIDSYGSRNLYLRGMPDSALSERLNQCTNNCCQLSSNGMIDLCATEAPDHFQRLIDVLAETHMRSGDVSKAQDSTMWSKERNVSIQPSDGTSKKIKRLKEVLNVAERGVALRFGSKKYMRQLYEAGGLLFQEASEYSKDGNLSVRDDELLLSIPRYIPKDELKYIPGAPDQRTIKGRGVLMPIKIPCPNFLVLCMTDAINYRLISDWDADAVVIIHDPTEFANRLRSTSEDLVRKAGGNELEDGKVSYIDPYFSLEGLDVPFSKHFKFAYQQEYRFVIRGENKLDQADRIIEMGSIEDIAELVEFDE